MPPSPPAETSPASLALTAFQVPPASLDEALAAFQADLPVVEKKKTAEMGDGTGGTYQYADLAECYEQGLPRLGKLGLSFTATPHYAWVKPDPDHQGQWMFVLDYALRHVCGEKIGGWWPLPDPSRFAPQEVGKAITYARRYSFCAITGIAPRGDDDDAHSVGGEAEGERKLRPGQKAQADGKSKDAQQANGAAQALADKAASIAEDPAGTVEQLALLVQTPAQKQRQLSAQVTNRAGERVKLSAVITAARSHIESRQGAASERSDAAE